MSTPITLAECSETGARKNNEDCVFYTSLGRTHYAIVADGAGGHKNGRLASQKAVACVRNHIESHCRIPFQSIPTDALAQAIISAHQQLCSEQLLEHDKLRMHTTMTLLWLDEKLMQAQWFHVGDSRVYMLRGNRIHSVTEDDSIVQSMVNAGFLTEKQAKDHPQRNKLLAMLGTEDEIQPHRSPITPIQEGDMFLLCSDGWYDPLGAASIELTSQQVQNADGWLQRMKLLIATRKSPKQDNYSAIAVWVGDPTDTTRPIY